jgi:HlyD family secretion protein
MTKKKKRIIITASIVVVLLVLFLIFKPKKADVVNLEKAKVAMGNLNSIVTATGTVKSINQVDVGTQVSGIIKKIYVDFNSRVKKGQILAEIDKDMLENELSSMKSSLDAAKIEYNYQSTNYKRQKELHSKNLISDSEFETSEYNYKKSKTSLDMANSNYIKTRTNLSYATIYSPIDGVVLNRAVEEGQTVAASFSTPTLFSIARDLSKMEIYANVDEADIGGVEVGQKVEFNVDAYPDDIFTGKVKQVRLQATTSSNVVTYQVIIEAPNEDLRLKPGLTANVSIIIAERANVLTIPAKALLFKPKEETLGMQWRIQKNKNLKGKYVWVTRGNDLVPVEITVGLNNGSKVEVLSGLKLNDEIVTGIVDKTAAKATTKSMMGGGPGPH